MLTKIHKPEFSWRVHGSTVNHELWIYDHEDPIARFDTAFVEQPEQSLRYFNLTPRPIVLRRLKLSPQGPPLIEGVQLYWVLKRSATIAGARAIATDRLSDLRIETWDSDRFELTIESQDAYGMASSKRILSLTYDLELESYVYDFLCTLEVSSPEEFYSPKGEVTFEYSDPWFVDLPAPSIAFPGAWKGRYQRFVYEALDGETIQVPINHFPSSHKSEIRLRENGLFAAVYEVDGNPALQILGETARRSVLSICPWGYDVHMGLILKPEELSRPIEARFRILQLSDDKAKRMESLARLRSLKPHEVPFSVVPAYSRRCSFETPCDANKPYEGIDPWPWTPIAGKGHAWETKEGRSDGYSLKIEKEDYGLAQWGIQHEGAGGWMGPWIPRRAVRISCFVKTKDVEGVGSSIAARYNIPNEPDVYPIVSSKRLRGTNDWTRLFVILEPAPEDAYFLHIFLRQEGRGTTWFDDLEVEYFKDELSMAVKKE
ncbi:MAG: hypothetical protein QXI39_02555 [Candidatus Bathyarchaeia archaeon]